ncbi:MAG: hypothetical protein GF405_11220 [Candidatus Eisenbacteria bacterium]|nr:hypothetical protein [Candidatus Eisenbacteria bacterium]
MVGRGSTLVVLTLWSVAILAGASAGVVIHVPGDQPTIQQAIFASSAGDTVIVAPGTYTSVLDTRLDFGGRNITLTSSAGPGATVLDAGGFAPIITLQGGEDTTSVISGLTFRNGGSDNAAVRCQHGSPQIRDCVFETNTGRYGALYLGSSFEATVRSCGFIGNEGDDGGAVHANGSLGRFVDCSFEGNSAVGKGGAVYLTFYAETRFDSCRFASNEAEAGGAVYSMNAESRFENCSFWGNVADDGSAVYLNQSYNPPEFRRCSFVSNDGGTLYSLAADAVVTNSILAFDRSGPALTCLLGEPFLSHCYVFGNAGGDSLSGFGSSNRFEDPLLCGIETGDLSLCANSACLPPANPWGETVGAFGAGCASCGSPVEALSWGGIKSLFRTPGCGVRPSQSVPR